MLRSHWSTIALLLTVLPLAPARAQEGAASERQAVLAAVDSLLDAMARHDVPTSRRLLVAGATLHSVLVGAPTATLQTQNDVSYLQMLATDTTALGERIWSPTTLIAGDVAQVWAEYDFHVNRTFSHCGVDSFTLLRSAAGWQVTSISYTVIRQGCAPSPLGPLGSAPAP